MNTERICRICCDQYVMCVDLFNEPDQQSPTLLDMLSEFCETRPDDGLPPHVCLGCASEAGIAYRFKRRYEQSQRHFYQLLTMNAVQVEQIEEEEPEENVLQDDIDLGCVKIETEQPETSIQLDSNEAASFQVTYIQEEPEEDNYEVEQQAEQHQFEDLGQSNYSEQLTRIQEQLAHRAASIKLYRAHYQRAKETNTMRKTHQKKNQDYIKLRKKLRKNSPHLVETTGLENIVDKRENLFK